MLMNDIISMKFIFHIWSRMDRTQTHVITVKELVIIETKSDVENNDSN
jgi:hypothetical protein